MTPSIAKTILAFLAFAFLCIGVPVMIVRYFRIDHKYLDILGTAFTYQEAAAIGGFVIMLTISWLAYFFTK